MKKLNELSKDRWFKLNQIDFLLEYQTKGCIIAFSKKNDITFIVGNFIAEHDMNDLLKAYKDVVNTRFVTERLETSTETISKLYQLHKTDQEKREFIIQLTNNLPIGMFVFLKERLEDLEESQNYRSQI